jgi:hypothetical protein
LAHTAYPEAIWNLTPTQSGKLPVAAGRGGSFNIDWEVHGKGDIKLVVSCFGLNGFAGEEPLSVTLDHVTDILTVDYGTWVAQGTAYIQLVVQRLMAR